MPQSDSNLAEADVLKPITSKTVLIAEPETIQTTDDLPSTGSYRSRATSTTSITNRRHHTNSSKRLSGRSARSIGSTASFHAKRPMSSTSSEACPSSDTASTAGVPAQTKPHHHVRRPHHTNHIISQITGWLHQEKAKQAMRRTKKKRSHLGHHGKVKEAISGVLSNDDGDPTAAQLREESSDNSDASFALAELERILTNPSLNSGDDTTPSHGHKRHGFGLHRHRSHKSSKLLRKASSFGPMSDSEAKDDEEVPSAEVILDNSRACTTSGKGPPGAGDHWLHFKREIVRLTHTLQIRAWRRIPIDDGSGIEVERLSGALTNAVYVVSPPPPKGKASESKKKARKLLLRIYGPQVEHLIDRDNELMILRRLAQKQIGPILLGTFTNGRFEQYFDARTLTPKDLRKPQTSEHIAKRMRELHDGIELLPDERNAGAFVWQNWDKWKERCDEVISWLDEEIAAGNQGQCRSTGDQWKKRGLVCGVEWSMFRQAVRQYRDWLANKYGGEEEIKAELVFAHNDTQYGNLLEMDPGGQSPLLLPENEHKRLKVIDFEYANANVPGLEFANHFTEWCYDYHDEAQSYALHESWYPTLDEQRRFIRAYVQHTPPIRLQRPTPSRGASSFGSRSSLSQFMLDNRSPTSTSYSEQERKREEDVEMEIERLLQETRLWRLANSAQWVAWGIVQAKVVGMEEALEARRNVTPTNSNSNHVEMQTRKVEERGKGDGGMNGSVVKSMAGLEIADGGGVNGVKQQGEEPGSEQQQVGGEGTGEEDDDEEAFDYLAYAQERALLFWGDALQVGIVRREDLPEELLRKVKRVTY